MPGAELILLPLVENAIKHGMSQATKVNRIPLCARREGDRLQLEVANTGRLDVGMTAENKGGVGLNNLRERLRLNTGQWSRTMGLALSSGAWRR